MYGEAIEKQKIYLKKILENPNVDPRDHLRRKGIVDRARKKYRGS